MITVINVAVLLVLALTSQVARPAWCCQPAQRQSESRAPPAGEPEDHQLAPQATGARMG